MDTYTVQITRLSDGVMREYKISTFGQSNEHNAYWWLHGNYECDCNRELCFERAGGVPESVVDELEPDCGSSRYAVRSPFFDDHATRGK